MSVWSELNLLKQCARIRLVELEIAKRYGEQQMRCPIHLAVGQEHCAVGICSALGPDDLVVCSHRSHHWYLAKGGNLNAMIAELYGKETGCSRGHGGSMHLVDWNCGFAGSTAIVAGTIPIAVGLAWAKRLRGEPGWVIAAFGDAATEEGVFHEAMNFASLHNLRVLFVCEDNGMSTNTPKELRQPHRPIAALAAAHLVDHYAVPLFEGVSEVRDTALEAMSRPGPAMITIECERHFEHCGPTRERPSDDHISQRILIGNDLIAEVLEAFSEAEAAPFPKKASAMYAI